MSMYDSSGILNSLGEGRRRGPYHLAEKRSRTKHIATSGVRKYGRPSETNLGYAKDADEIPAQDFRTSDEFRCYARRIERIVLKATEPLKLREIHEQLGDDVRRNWTLDAIESLKTVETITGLVDKFQPVGGWIPAPDFSQTTQEN